MAASQEIVQRYIDSFNETDATRRGELLHNLYTSDSTYTDPHVDLCGASEIDGFIAQTQERSPALSSSWPGRSTPITTRPGSSGRRGRPSSRTSTSASTCW